jgi:hypothetical protein
MEYLRDWYTELGLLTRKTTPETGKWILEIADTFRIETVSVKDGAEELTTRGQAYDIVALVEAGLIRDGTFPAAVGRVAETRGEVILSGTLWDSSGWYANLYRAFGGANVYGGERFSFPSWLNTAIYPGGREDPEIKRLEAILPAEEFLRRVGGGLVPSAARMYPEFTPEKHVAKVEYDKDLPVYLAVDAGYYPSHYAVVPLQLWDETFTLENGSVVTMEVVHQIGEIWEHHQTHHDIYDLCKQKPWWKGVERVLLGHEGKQHQAADSTQEVWRGLLRADERDVTVTVFNAKRRLDGVVRVKTFLKDPATNCRRFVQDVSCKGSRHEFETWSRKTNSKGEVRSEEPEDANDDALDCIRNFMVWKYGLVEKKARKPTGGRPRVRYRG